MKRTILKLTACAFLASAIVLAPALSRAQDTNTPAASAAGKHKRSTLPFYGKLSAVDANAMTLTVGQRTFQVNSQTKITRDGQPATLSDGVAGEMVGGAYKKSDDGKLTAVSVHFGVKKKNRNSNAITNSMGN